MATIALAAGAAALGGKIAGTGAILGMTGAQLGWLVGGAAGSIIDGQLLIPSLTKPQKIKGPRLDDFDVTLATEGEGICRCWGTHARVPGTYIWIGKQQEAVIRERSGGKGGGPAVEQERYVYRTNLAVGIARNEISKVLKIWADNEVIYQAKGADLQVQASSFDVLGRVLFINNQTNFVWYGGNHMVIRHSTEDITVFEAGRNVTVSGFTNSDNNGTFRYIMTRQRQAGGGWGAPYWYELWLENPDSVDETGSGTVTISQTPAEFEKGLWDSYTFHLGTMSQTVDSVMEGEIGTGDVPAYRGLAYAVFGLYNTTDFGGRPPQISFLIEQDSGCTLDDVIGDILEIGGLSGSDYDVSALSGQAIKGYTIQGIQSPAAMLTPLISAFDLVIQESQGELIWRIRGNETPIELGSGETAAMESGDSPPAELDLDEVDDTQLPTHVAVKYLDPDRDYQVGSRSWRKGSSSGYRPESIELGSLVLAGDTAQEIAHRRVYQHWGHRYRVRGFLPPSRLAVEDGDVIEFTYNGETYQVEVEELTRGRNGLIEWAGITRQVIGTAGASHTPGQSSGIGMYLPQFTIAVPMNLPALVDGHGQAPGYYIGALAGDPERDWRGGYIYHAPQDSDALFELLQAVPVELTFGAAEDALAEPTEWRLPDFASTVTVTLLHGELESVTWAELLAGANLALLGAEIIQFQTATLIGPRQYTLSGLLRGRRQTWSQERIGTHAAADAFVLLNDKALTFREILTTSIGREHFFRGVSAGEDVDDVESAPIVFTAENLRAAPVARLVCVQNAPTTFDSWTWSASTRRPVWIFGEKPYLEDDVADSDYRYYIQLRDNSSDELVFYGGWTYQGNAGIDIAHSVYTAAEAAGYSTKGPHAVEVFRYTDRLGPGRLARVMWTHWT